MPKEEFQVPAELDGARVDKAALALMKGLSRAQVKRAISEGSIRVQGRYRAKGAPVAAGEVLSLATEVDVNDGAAVPTPDSPLQVVYESSAVVIVDKPAGQPTAPLRAGEVGTLVNALVGRYREMADVGYGPREPGILHRLDTGTSGLVVAARSKEAFLALSSALKAGQIIKEYTLVCASEDLPDASVIEFPIAKHPKDQRRVYPCVHPRDVARYAPRPASTSYTVLRREGPWAVVVATVSRALRHQIRAHFAAIDHPLAGDTLYGGPPAAGLARHALHASRVAFAGEPREVMFDATSPFPAELLAVLKTALPVPPPG